MNKKTAYIIFIILFFAVCIVPSAGMLVVGEAPAAANEIVTTRPQLFLPDGTFNANITDDLTSYFADRFAFRQNFITAYAKIQAAAFGESSSDDVILGKDGWLFYEATKNDYLHRDTLSNRSIQGIARTLLLMQQYSEERGTRFLFTVAPNKNSVTPSDSMMPNVGTPLDTPKNLDMLCDAMEKCGVHYAELREALSEEMNQETSSAADGQDAVSVDTDGEALDSGTMSGIEAFLDGGRSLYHRLDSHWNNMGAAVGLRELTKNLGVESYPWTEESFTIQKNHKGDLYEMIYPAGKELDENVVFDKKFEFTYVENNSNVPFGNAPVDSEVSGENVQGDTAGTAGGESASGSKSDGSTDIVDTAGMEKQLSQKNYYSKDAPQSDSIKIETRGGRTEGRLLMFRDSFGNALYPFLADTFSEAAFSRLMPYRMDWLDTVDADDLIVEIVERNIKDLAAKAPVMPALKITGLSENGQENDESPINDRQKQTGTTDEESVQNRKIENGQNDDASFLDDEQTPDAEKILPLPNEFVNGRSAKASVSYSTEMPGYYMVSGTYDDAEIDEDTRVLLDTGSAVYEACPVGTALSQAQNDACFTAFLSEEALNTGTFSVILCRNGQFCRYGCEITWM